MDSVATRVANGVFGLVAVWILTYWLYPVSTHVTADPVPLANPVRIAPDPDGPVVAPRQDTPPGKSVTPAPVDSRVETKRVDTVIPPEFRDYTVQAGDTFQTISRRVYGTPAHADAIARANALKDPKRLKAGQVIRVPKDPANVQGLPTTVEVQVPVDEPVATAADQTYEVKPGDSLSSISQKFYGSVRFADLIFQANTKQLSSPDKLRVGQKIVIPPKPAAAPGSSG